jgi:uncharacterized phage protein gp47/JayE
MLDATGFTRPRYDDLFADIEDKAKEAFGEDADTGEATPLGSILRLFAWFLADIWEDVEDVYNSAYKNAAEGNSLDKLGPYVGTARTLAQHAIGEATLVGTSGHTEPAGFRASTPTGIVFETTADVTLSSGSGIVAIRAVEAGISGNVAARMITTIVNPSANVTAVTNLVETSGGRDKETDEEFRSKWDESVAGGGSATEDAIRSAVLRVPGVRAAAAVVNNTISPDVNGQPAKSVQTYVLGGAAQAIGEAIFSRVAGGIETYGSTSVTVLDLSGHEQSVKYSPAEVVRIYANVTITKNASYPADGDVGIKSALVRHIGGTDIDGTVYAGLSMDNDVIYTRLIAALYSVPGVDDVDLELSTNGTSFAQVNVPISRFQVAQINAADIGVTS